MSHPICSFCDGPCIPSGCTSGYGIVTPEGPRLAGEGEQRACFACCAWLDVMAMRRGEAIALYVDADGAHVRNWPGTLALVVLSRKDGRHNIAGRKSVYHFRGPDGSRWTGTEYHGPASGNLLRGVRSLASSKKAIEVRA